MSEHIVNITEMVANPPLPAPIGSATPRSGQCECCSSPLGEAVTVDGVAKIICDKCLGFIARWLIEMDAQNTERSHGAENRKA